MNKEKVYSQIQDYFSDKPVKRVSLFGSFARDENNDASDIDLLITPQQPLGLFALGRYIADLEDLIKIKIDLTTEGSLSKEFYNGIQKDIKVLYAK